MSYKVAFASSDGKVVNTHFGKAKKFHIVQIDEDSKTFHFIESRDNVPSCNNFQHTESGLKSAINVISDCKAVFVAKIGDGAREKLQERNIKAIEAPYFINDIIDKLINSKVKLI